MKFLLTIIYGIFSNIKKNIFSNKRWICINLYKILHHSEMILTKTNFIWWLKYIFINIDDYREGKKKRWSTEKPNIKLKFKNIIQFIGAKIL